MERGVVACLRIKVGVLSPSHRGTRCSLSGSCPRIAQRSWAFRRRGPADSAVRPALHLGAHAVSPARLQRIETPPPPSPPATSGPARRHPIYLNHSTTT